ncbi:MAG: TonB-dependent receptor [Acidobacteriaceae bacterium]
MMALYSNDAIVELIADIYDTSNGNGAGSVPYSNNQIPINNPVAQYLFSNPQALPLPNHAPEPGSPTRGNFQGPVSSFNYNNQADLRIDYAARNNDTFMLKGTWGDAYDGGTENPLPTSFVSGDDFPFSMISLGWVHTFTPAVVNDARAGFSRVIARLITISDPSGIFGKSGNSLVGVPLPSPQTTVGFTNMQVNTGDLSDYGTSPGAGNQIVDNNFDYSDTLTWHHGNHNTKFGGQFIRYQENFIEVGNQGGALGFFNYTGVYTAAGDSPGYGFADFVLDKATTSQIAPANGFFGQRQWRTAYFVQDDWKVLPNLTLNLGLRYSYDQPLYEVHNRMVSIDLPAARFHPNADFNSLLLFAGKNGNSRALYNPTHNEWQPRIGFAFQFNPRMVLRGGYGITTAMEGTGNGLRMTQNPPFLETLAQGSTPPSDTGGGTPLRVENGFGTAGAGGSNFSVWDPNFRPAMVQQFNLGVQIQAGNSTSFQIGYVGQVGNRLAVPAALNQWTAPLPADCADTPDAPNCAPTVAPYYSVVGANNQLIDTISEGVSNYHALQASIEHRETNGLTFQLHYTLAKSLTNNAGGFFTTPGVAGEDSFWQNVYDPQADYGPSDFDVRQNLVGTMVYQLPFGRGKRFGANWNIVTDEVLGGWQLAGSAFLISGLPVTLRVNPNCSTNCPGLLDGVERPNQYRKLKIVHRSLHNWFGTDPSVGTKGGCQGAGIDNGTCAYGIPSPDSFGTAGVGSQRAAGQRKIDLSLSKAFTTFHEQALTFRADSFNAFNLASYGAPFNRVGSGLFGSIRNTLAPQREFQLSLAYKF